MSDSFSGGMDAVSAGRLKRRFGRILLVVGIALAMMALLMFYLSYRHYQAEMDSLLLDPARDYSRVPFNMTDATEYCQQRTQHRYGDALAFSHIDEHSTRMDRKTGLYKVFLFVRVGNLRDYEEEAIHCFVDPQRRVLTYYRAINLRKASLMSKAAQLFGF